MRRLRQLSRVNLNLCVLIIQMQIYVGHTGVIPAVIESVEAVDEGVGRLMEALKKVNGVLICSADHRNSDDMVQLDKKINELMRDAVDSC